MLEQKILAYASQKGFHQQTLNRWLRLATTDREALLDLALQLKMGENHFRDFLDWLEEISLRDSVSLYQILNGQSFLRILSDPRPGRNDKLKQMKEEVRRLRFPRLARMEEEIRKRIREMRLSRQIQLTVPSGLEGGTLTVQMTATNYGELEKLVREFARALDQNSLREIFAILDGGENARF